MEHQEEHINLAKAVVQPIWAAVDVLRLDSIHPVVSGNKWFKLKYHLQEAIAQQKHGIITMGGAWSNHLVATAYACKQAGLKALGVIRGETMSDTLKEAQSYGMELQFVSRSVFDNEIPERAGYYFVPLGGQSNIGVQGAAEILALTDVSEYTHIACAVGTGTMMAGLVKASLPHQQVIGITSIKDESVPGFVAAQSGRNNFTILYDYHFGGFARKTSELLQFMNILYEQQQLPTDFVYTGKLLFGIQQLLATNYFATDSRILVIHSGGLQGNRSLPEGTLLYLPRLK